MKGTGPAAGVEPDAADMTAAAVAADAAVNNSTAETENGRKRDRASELLWATVSCDLLTAASQPTR